MKRLLWIAVALSAIPASAAPTPTALEPVTITRVLPGAKTTALSLRAASGGCTSAKDFKVVVAQEAKRQLLTIVRTRQDVCEAYAPDGAAIDLATADLVANKPIIVANPLFVSHE